MRIFYVHPVQLNQECVWFYKYACMFLILCVHKVVAVILQQFYGLSPWSFKQKHKPEQRAAHASHAPLTRQLMGKEEEISCDDGVFCFYHHGGIVIQQAAEAFTPAANRQPDRV